MSNPRKGRAADLAVPAELIDALQYAAGTLVRVLCPFCAGEHYHTVQAVKKVRRKATCDKRRAYRFHVPLSAQWRFDERGLWALPDGHSVAELVGTALYEHLGPVAYGSGVRRWCGYTPEGQRLTAPQASLSAARRRTVEIIEARREPKVRAGRARHASKGADHADH